MKYLIAGLGNMGPEYHHTRHNIGFQVVDHMAEAQSASFKNDRYGDLATIKNRGRTYLLLKPSTYMNRSGKAVNYWLQKEKIPPSKLLVIVDDINLDFGQFRLRPNGSDGGHNGLRDIIANLGHQNFPRLRIGIGSDFPQGRQVDYVLGKWGREEKKQLPEILDRAEKAVYLFGSIGVQRTMNEVNG